MEVKELGHIVLFVRDLAKSAHFYRDVLGFKTVQVELPGMLLFSAGRTHHELMLIEVGEDAPTAPRGRRAGLYHLALKIGDSLDDLRAAKADLEAAGVPINYMSDHYVSKSIYLLDPDGNEVEIFIDDPAIDWRANPAAGAVPPKALVL